MIQLTFQFETMQDLHDFTARQAVPIPLAPAPAEASAEPVVVATPIPNAETVVAVDLDAVRKAVMAVNDNFGLIPARRVLKKFNVARVTELEPEQYADFVKACGEVK